MKITKTVAPVMLTLTILGAAPATAQECSGFNTEAFLATATAENVQACLDAGANLDAGNVLGETPLHNAARFGTPETILILLNAGALVNAGDVGGETPLHKAALWSTPEVIRILLDAGAALEGREDSDRTPLHMAATQSNLEAVQALLDAGAELCPKVGDGVIRRRGEFA